MILGLALLLNPDVLTDPASVAGTPSTSDMIFAFTLDARDVRGRRRVVGPGRRGRGRPPRAQAPASRARLLAFIPYVGIALVAVSVLPLDDRAALGPDNYVDAPMLGVAAGFEQAWLSEHAAAPDRRSPRSRSW